MRPPFSRLLKIAALLFLPAVLLSQPAALAKKQEENLEFENILDLKKAREEKIAAREREEAKKKKAETKSKKSPEADQEGLLKFEAKSRRKLEQILKTSKTNPPELAFLELPDNFYKAPKEELLSSDFANFLESKGIRPEYVVGVWRLKGTDVRVIAEKTVLNQQTLANFTDKAFEEELKRVGEEFNDFYRNNFRARAGVKISRKGPAGVMVVTSKYLIDQDWYSDTRFFYFYRPEHRVSLMISGKEEELDGRCGGIRQALKIFFQRLALFYPDGIVAKTPAKT